MSSYQGGPYQPSPPGITPPPPPGMTPPSQFGPEPMGPGGRGSNPWKFLLIGCAVVAFIGIIALAGTCAYMGTKGSKLIANVMELGKSEYMKMLSPEHTEAQREDFSDHYDLMSEKLSEMGIIKFSTEYAEVFDEFNRIGMDGEITVEESREWIENFDLSLEKG